MKTEANFHDEVKSAFKFLELELGFHIIRESSDEGLAFVEYGNDSVYVRVSCTGPDFEPRMFFGRSEQKGTDGIGSFDWVDLKELACCESWTWSSDPNKPYNGRISELARLLKECGRDCLRGDEDVYRSIARRRNELLQQHVREEYRTWVEQAAEVAWTQKRYREYVELLRDFDELSASARSRLEFAQKKLRTEMN